MGWPTQRGFVLKIILLYEIFLPYLNSCKTLDMAAAANFDMGAAHDPGRDAVHYPDRDAVPDHSYIYDPDANFLIQIDENLDGTVTVIEARTSHFKSNIQKSNINEIIIELIRFIYKKPINIDNLIKITDLNDNEFKGFLDKLDPTISLPVTPNTVRYFASSEPDRSIIVLRPIPENNVSGEIKKWGFYDSKTNEKYEISDLQKQQYIEKTLEQVKFSPKLVPIVPQSAINSEESFIKYYNTELSSVNLCRGNCSTKGNIIEMFNDKFAKHISFSYPFFKKAINSYNVSDKVAASSNSKIQSLVNDGSIPIPYFPYFTIVNFLRSYIDLYHDIVEYGKPYCDKLKIEFELNFPENGDHAFYRAFYNKWIHIIDKSIFTKSRKINQTSCKLLIEKLTDEFIDLLHTAGIKYIPKNKENSNVMSASIDDEEQIIKLIKTLKADGVTGFYVESANNNIGDILLSGGLTLCDLTIGEWDAGSGYKGGKQKHSLTKKIIIGPIAAATAAAVTEYPIDIFDIQNIPIDIFNTFKINVSADNNTLTVSSRLTNAEPIITISGPIQLAVNRILKTTDNVRIRGSEDTTKISDIVSRPPISPKSEFDLKMSLIPLKTWTDLIQIVTISKSMTSTYAAAAGAGAAAAPGNPLKILTVIYDGLCETTARMYGLGHVLKTEGKIVTYYNYNINSRKLTPAQIREKLIIQYNINRNIELFIDYLNKWFNQRISALQYIYDNIYDPVMFFISKLFIEKYISANKKSIELLLNIEKTDIKLIPNSLDDYIESISSSATLLGDLVDYISKFNLAIEMIEKIRPRINPKDFLEIYDYVQQQITNTFGNNEPIDLRTMIATTFAFVFIKKHNYAQYTLALNGIKKEINSQERNEQLKSKKISNIIDIEIAYDKLLSIDNPFNSNGNILTYQKYITEIYQRPFIQIKPEWAFLNIIKSVKAKITAQEAANAKTAQKAANANMNANMSAQEAANPKITSKRPRSNDNNRTNGNPKTSRTKGGMKTRNNHKLMKKHRTRKRKNKKRRTHKKK